MPAVRRYKSIEDTRKALAAFLRRIETGSLDEKTGRCLIYGCSTLAAIQRDSQIEERLDQLEAAQRGETE